MQSPPDRTGSPASGALHAALELARGWAGDSCRALVLSGSHASGEAVWINFGDRRVSLSDVDLYACMPNAEECRQAEARARAGRAGLAQRLLERGLAGPLEVAFLTPHDLEHLPARPATLELKRHARVIQGDPAAAQVVPAYGPQDVPAEEALLLLENRAFELLGARSLLEGAALDRWRARHAVLKCALDLAAVLALERGKYPDGAASRVAWARSEHVAPELELETLWEVALAWRRTPRPWESAAAAHEEWRRAARAWGAVWDLLSAARVSGETDPVQRAVRLAARARVRRRFRHALSFETRSASGPGAWSRWRFAARGTPQHRLNASATLLLLAANGSPGPPELPLPVREALRHLGALPTAEIARFDAAASAAVKLWDRWILDGQRTAATA